MCRNIFELDLCTLLCQLLSITGRSTFLQYALFNLYKMNAVKNDKIFYVYLFASHIGWNFLFVLIMHE